jgi:competence protein ComEC
MGDASSKVEKVILNENIDSDVLKVGHHGSKYSTSINFLKKVTPDVAVISVGEGNSYEHPHDVTMNNLNKNDVDVYRTDVDGTIMVTTDGVSFNVEKLEVNLNG